MEQPFAEPAAMRFASITKCFIVVGWIQYNPSLLYTDDSMRLDKLHG